MSQAQLNFDEDTLDRASALYSLYSKLYNGMVLANQTTPPDYVNNPPYMMDGADPVRDQYGDLVLDVAEITRQISEFTKVQSKNAAYLLANSITTVLGGTGSSSGGTGTGGVFLSRSGDSMDGALGALKGFQAGYNNIKIFETVFDNADPQQPWAIVTGNLRVTKDAEVNGAIKVSSEGIYIGGNQALYIDNGALTLEWLDVHIKGATTFDTSITLDKFLVNSSGVYWDTHPFYHEGNSNNATTDWSMKDAIVYGDLEVKGKTTLQGKLQSNGGFCFSSPDSDLLYSDILTITNPDTSETTSVPYVVLNSDLSIINNHGIKFDQSYIVKVRDENGINRIVSFSAPGMVMNLGDSSDGVPTKRITLQSDLCTYDSISDNPLSVTKIITKEGAGYFPNGLAAKCATSGPLVMNTYASQQSNDVGVVFPHNIRFGSASGPAMYTAYERELIISLPYDGKTLTWVPFTLSNEATTSFLVAEADRTSTLNFNIPTDLFSFNKPIESIAFAIKSESYETALIENQLFFGEGTFIEGLPGGMGWNGDADFADDLFSYDPTNKRRSFISGFAGAGWAIMEDTWGDFHATFDSLTVRKKMRVYELEVQKISVTNGSLWVSDACSGDEVIAIE